jgi:hypothetical protein
MDENLASAHGFRKPWLSETMAFGNHGFRKLDFPKFMKGVPHGWGTNVAEWTLVKMDPRQSVSSSKRVLVKVGPRQGHFESAGRAKALFLGRKRR